MRDLSRGDDAGDRVPPGPIQSITFRAAPGSRQDLLGQRHCERSALHPRTRNVGVRLSHGLMKRPPSLPRQHQIRHAFRALVQHTIEEGQLTSLPLHPTADRHLWLAGMGTPPIARAEPSMPLAQPQAANLARMRAESLNGGLDSYRAAGCMYETGARACLVTCPTKGSPSDSVAERLDGNSSQPPTPQPGDHCARLERWHQNPGGSLQRLDPMSPVDGPSSIKGPQQFC